TATSGSPDLYAITWDTPAADAGFEEVTGAMLPPDQILIVLPVGVIPGSYNGTVTVINSLTGCSSEPYPFTLVIHPMPVVTCPAGFDICSAADPVTLSGGDPEGGTYSGPGVSGGQFDPGLASVGLNTIEYAYVDTN